VLQKLHHTGTPAVTCTYSVRRKKDPPTKSSVSSKLRDVFT